MSDALVPLVTSTREFLGKLVAGEKREARLDPFRDSAGLVGTWVGAFAQWSIVRNTVTATEVTFDTTDSGTSRDAFGDARIDRVLATAERLTFSKTYNGFRYVYVGARREGQVAGYWYASGKPDFCGVFALTRSDGLTPEALASVVGQIERQRRFKLQHILLNVLPLAAFAVTIQAASLGAGWSAVVGAAFIAFSLFSRVTLTRRVSAWKKALGDETPELTAAASK